VIDPSVLLWFAAGFARPAIGAEQRLEARQNRIPARATMAFSHANV
jgi:hypothetical protein